MSKAKRGVDPGESAKPGGSSGKRKDPQDSKDVRKNAKHGKHTKQKKKEKDRAPVGPADDRARLAPAAAPVGQRLYDMPYSAVAPRLISPEIGLHNLVTRAGHNAHYTIDVTLLDAPDHRLIRSGVLLAHRVLDGRGEWYLGAPDWQPALPAERIEPMGQAELPEEFAELIRPFRRRAPLGPVAALSCERREFALRDDRGGTLALLRDDKVTVRRGGLTTARYREVMVTPMGGALNEEQAAYVARALANAGATQVTRFPRLVTRLGAPATGPTDFPQPQSLDSDSTFAQFVSHLLAMRLRQILLADLAVRSSVARASADLAKGAGQLRLELQGLASVVDVSWLEDLDEELLWVAGQVQRDGPRSDADEAAVSSLLTRLRGERYLTLLDRLVTATRAPQLGNASALQASEVMGSLLNLAVGGVVKAAGRLTVESATEDWQATSAAFEELFRVSEVALHLLPDRVQRLRHRLGVATQLLEEAGKHGEAAERNRALAARSSADDAFALGRAYEHELAVARLAREAFVRRWAKTAKKLT